MESFRCPRLVACICAHGEKEERIRDFEWCGKGPYVSTPIVEDAFIRSERMLTREIICLRYL